MPPINVKDIATLIELFENSSWKELDFEMDGTHIFLSNDATAHSRLGGSGTQPSTRFDPSATHREQSEPRPTTMASEKSTVDKVPEGMIAVRARNLGTFYRSPKPGAPPYVQLDQTVEADTEMCLIEVMKLFTALRAGAPGVIRRICVEDGDMVQGDQILFLLEPAG